MPESLTALWRNASPLKRVLLAGVPAVVIALGAAGVIYAGFSGGGSAKAKQEVLAATQSPSTPTKVPATATFAPQPKATPETVPEVSSNSSYTGGSDGGGGGDYETYEAPSEPLSGPGPIQGTSWSLSIPVIGVNANVYSRTIGGDGQMGNPAGAYDVVWYDFAADGWTGLGGVPGEPGANVVMAGHVDYIGVGAAVFYSIRDLQPGDIVTVNTDTGPINYAIQWNQWAEPDQDFTSFVSQTGQDSITLVTCIGGFSAGHYSNRLIVRGVRV